MDYEKEWKTLRGELYDIVKRVVRLKLDNKMWQSYGNVLLWMIYVEDNAAGINAADHHVLSLDDIIALYEARERD